jgi:hypothetical protein
MILLVEFSDSFVGRIVSFPCRYHFIMVNHAHISPGVWTVGPLAAVQRRSLTPPTWWRWWWWWWLWWWWGGYGDDDEEELKIKYEGLQLFKTFSELFQWWERCGSNSLSVPSVFLSVGHWIAPTGQFVYPCWSDLSITEYSRRCLATYRVKWVTSSHRFFIDLTKNLNQFCRSLDHSSWLIVAAMEVGQRFLCHGCSGQGFSAI